MPLAYPVYYVTRAKDELVKLVETYGKPYLTDTEVWHNEEATPPSEADFQLMKFKMVFLARWKLNLEDSIDSKNDELLEILLGKPPFNIHQFDKWWTVERLPIWSTGVNEYLSILSIDELEAFAPTGDSEFDSWKEKIKVYAKKNPRGD